MSAEVDAGEFGELRVASYNIHSCVGTDRQCRPSRIAAVLRELDCHVVALQEVDNQPGNEQDSMQLDYLSEAVQMAAVPGLRIVRHTGEYGNALLTRLPILSVQRHDLSYARYEPRGALDVTLELAGRELKVIATHLGLRRAERRIQWDRLLSVITQCANQMPLVILGDMNEWYRGSQSLGRVNQILGEVTAPVAFPSFAPCLALTRIWVHPRTALLSVAVHRSAIARHASDHLPIKAAIRVANMF